MMRTLSIDLIDEEASERFGQQLAQVVCHPLVITFHGDIGAGKTTIIRAMLKAMGIRSTIKSPTFTLVESYQCQEFVVHHFDLYRICHEEELEYLGFRDYFTEQSICCMEWAEHAGQLLPEVDVCCHLSTIKKGRQLQVKATSVIGEKIVAYLAGE